MIKPHLCLVRHLVRLLVKVFFFYIYITLTSKFTKIDDGETKFPKDNFEIEVAQFFLIS